MDLKATLLKEHSKAQCMKVVKYVGGNKERFAALMKLFLQDEYRITQRAAWPVSYCVENHPELVTPYYKKLIDYLEKPDVPEAIARNTVRLLQHVDIPEKHHGRVMTVCFNFIQSNEAPISVKAFSLRVLENLSKQYPEILPELKAIILERWDYESPAFKSRARKILK